MNIWKTMLERDVYIVLSLPDEMPVTAYTQFSVGLI